MPSLYEPFGMANELCLNGTVAIGRATGGITQQIVPLRSVTSFSKSVQQRADNWHAREDSPTGFLYREADRFLTNEANWQAINTTAYRIDGGYPDRIEERNRFPLFNAMAKALENCINDAVILYQSKPEQYYQLIVNGIKYIQNNFSWEQAAQDYFRTLV
jgi:glycogen synthase